jgi:chromosome segregation ATPase
VYRERIKVLQGEVEVVGQKNQSQEQLLQELKEDMMKLLAYKNDLEVVIEE